jgi:molybdate transport system substrate-binding protein
MLRMLSLVTLAAAVLANPAAGADLKVTSAGAVRGLMARIIDDYSRQTGQKFEFTVGTTGQLRAIIGSGFPADLIITSAPLMGELEKTGNITSRTDLGRVGLGIAVRDGTGMPNVTTADGFKKTLLDAPRIADVDPNSGPVYGSHLRGVYQSLGIADVVLKKSIMQIGGKEVAEAVANGAADIGVAFISEIIHIKGAKLAGPFPPALQGYTVYAAAIPKASTDPTAARAFIDALVSPAMARRWTEAGFEAPK